MVKLEEFEVYDHCKLTEWQIGEIKNHIEYTIDVINRGLAGGKDFYLDGFIQSYWNELTGMRSICSMIGLSVKTKYEEN